METQLHHECSVALLEIIRKVASSWRDRRITRCGMFKKRVKNFQDVEQFDLSWHGKLNRAFSPGRNARSSWISHRSSPTSGRETRLFQHSALLVLTRVVRKMESFEHVDFSSPNSNFDFWLIARTLSYTRDESKARGEKTGGELFTRPVDPTGNFYFFSSLFLTF